MVDMNPVLLKPETDTGAQVIVQGKRLDDGQGPRLCRAETELLAPVLESFDRLASAELISSSSRARAARPRSTCAPATSPTWASPRAADVPVVLVGDIDRGGVIAQLVGTHAVLDPRRAAMIRGFIVNKFRGDPRCSTTAIG